MAEQEQQQEQQAPQAPQQGKSGSGLDQNVAGLLCYALAFITGIIFLIIEKDNKFVRFHAIQSIIFSIAAYAVNIILTMILLSTLLTGGFTIVGLLSTGFSILVLVLWVMCMYKAYNNEEWQIPLIGGIAKSMVK